MVGVLREKNMVQPPECLQAQDNTRRATDSAGKGLDMLGGYEGGFVRHCVCLKMQVLTGATLDYKNRWSVGPWETVMLTTIL